MSRAGLIPRNSLVWLLTAQIVVLAPHLPRLPIWVAVLWLVCAVWRVQIQRMRWNYPGKLIKALALVTCCVGVFSAQGTLIGLDAAVMLLLVLFMLKLLEMRAPRDALVVIYLGFFIVATAFLFDQNILLAAYQCFSLLILVAALVGLQQTPGRNDPARAFRTGAVMLGQAIPLMIVLFLVFPRIGPLWAVNVPGQDRVGLAESMAPGDMAEVARSGNLAFRASFAGDIPPHPQLYWRALTLSHFDGRKWSHSGFASSGPVRPWEAVGEPITYQVMIPPTGQPWTFSLRGATTLDDRLILTGDFMLQARKPISQTLFYTATSWPLSRLDPDQLDPLQMKLYTGLPEGSDPRSRAWAAELREQYPADLDLIQAVLAHFNREPYYYTLKPPRLGRHTNDEFLFDARRGFCAHFAGAMAFVLRAAGIPARIVAGYQGGEINPRGNYVLVHQFDAHAWVEAWIPGQGWISVDPTFQVAPERIEQGIQQAIMDEGTFLEDAPLASARYRTIGWVNNIRLAWDDVNYQWQMKVLGYESERQLDFFKRWLGTTDWQRIGLYALAAVLLVMLPVAIWILRPQRIRRDPRQKAWKKLNDRLARIGLQADTGEGPRAWQARLSGALPKQRTEIDSFFDEYVRLSYSGQAQPGDRGAWRALRGRLNRLLRSLPRRKPPRPSAEVVDQRLPGESPDL